MRIKGLKQNGVFFGLWVLIGLGGFFTPLHSYSGVNDQFTLEAPHTSTADDAIDHFVYDSQTGALYQKFYTGDGVTLREITAFQRIPGLNREQIEIVAANKLHPPTEGETPLIAVRHGYWVSILDPVHNVLFNSNIGPSLPGNAPERFSHILKAPDGAPIVVFTGDALNRRDAGDGSEYDSFLFVVNAQTHKVGWFTVRTDQLPLNLNMSVRHGAESGNDLELAIHCVYRETLKVRNNRNTGATEESSRPRVTQGPLSSETVFNLTTGQVTQEEGANLLSTGTILSTYTAGHFEGMHPIQELPQRLHLDNVTPQALAQTGSPANALARNAGIALANEEIEFSRRAGHIVRESLSHIYGQASAVDALVSIVRQQVAAIKHTVFLLGGPTGVGKTATIEAFAAGWLEANHIQSNKPFFRISLDGHHSPEIFKNALIGSTPPYIGSESPSSFISWLLENPDGGIIFFDEIDKAPPAVLESQLSFLENGEMRLSPALTKALLKIYGDLEVEKWPRALREATNDGSNVTAEIVIRLTPRHMIALGTNAGENNYGMNGSGRELRDPAEIRAANLRFTSEVLKREIRQRGFQAALLGRINSYIPMGMLLQDDHALVVRDYVAKIEQDFRTRLIEFRFSDAARRFLETESYDPQSGARNVARQIDDWVRRNLTHSVVEQQVVRPGDSILIDVLPGNGKTVASVLRLHRDGSQEHLAEYEVGRPLPPSPRALLAKARQDLMAVLQKRILGHRQELQQGADAVIGQLARAVHDPGRQGRPVVQYFDGTPGVGKTEYAKAVSEALYGDSNRMLRIDFNDIVTIDQLYDALRRMADAVNTSPEGMVLLWDELPRAGAGSGHAAMMFNVLMSVLDEGTIPPKEKGGEKISLPPGTVIIATGNLAVSALGGGTDTMSNRELLAHFRLMSRHPESFLAEYARAFPSDAFRSRLGAPILFFPLTLRELAVLRNRFFTSSTAVLRDAGVKAVLATSARRFFLEENVPIEGARWIRRKLQDYIENPLITMVTGNEDRYRGTDFEVVWHAASREMRVVVKRQGAIIETRVLATVPRTRSEYHPETRERAAWAVSVHEAGHAILESYFFGTEAINELNTFPGGRGGWMERNFNAPLRDMYHGTRQGLKQIAVALAGHRAEVRYITDEDGNPQSTEGASSDYQTIRSVAQTMILDGSIPEIAPISLITNPSTHQVVMSDEKLRELEHKTDLLMQMAGALVTQAFEENEIILMEVAQKLHASMSMSMSGEEFRALVGDRIVTPVNQDYINARETAIAEFRRMQSAGCEQFLMTAGATLPNAMAPAPVEPPARRSYLQRIADWIRRF